ncbi:exodeoxyribonuclease V subunit alpha [Thalassotalea fusca]
MSDTKPLTYSCPYSTFARANEVIADITPIDYFFAKHTSMHIVGSQSQLESNNTISQAEFSELFHLLMVLHCTNRAGDICVSIEQFANKVFGFESDEQGVIVKQGYRFSELAAILKLLLDDLAINQWEFPVLIANNKLYLRRYYQFEQEVRLFVEERTNEAVALDKANVKKLASIVQMLFPNSNQQSSQDTEIDWQKVAVANALNKRFVVIAGGPGTGKTYTVTKLLAALVALHNEQTAEHEQLHIDKRRSLKIALTAPTGKAAQRLSESISNAVVGFKGQIDESVLSAIPRQAQTIHRLLGVIPEQLNFKHNKDNPLSIDVLLVDEVSMVDLPLMARLTRALPSHCRVIFLGDADQLPSVGAGCVLEDLAPRPHPGFSIENNKLIKQICEVQGALFKGKGKVFTDHLTFLLHSRRFDGQGGIGRLAKAVIEGKSEESWQLLLDSNSPDSDCHIKEQLRLLPTERKVWLAAHVKQFYSPIMQCDSVTSAFEQLAKYRILCATRVGQCGVDSLNDEVESLLQMQGVIPYRQALYLGKPIMISQNDYHLGLFNGDIGLIWPNENNQLMAVFERDDGDLYWVLPSRLPKYETVYAMTIHKTQGSEFNHSVIVLPEQANNRLLSRELLYTGITRGKTKVSVHASKQVWQQTVVNQIKRMSGLDLFR